MGAKAEAAGGASGAPKAKAHRGTCGFGSGLMWFYDPWVAEICWRADFNRSVSVCLWVYVCVYYMVFRNTAECDRS